MTSRIAISQRVVENESYPETRDALALDWARWVAEVLPRAALLPVPNLPESVEAWWGAVAPEALFLSGGNDLGSAPARDDTERRLLACARRAHVPVLAVCRGMHVVNDYFGGRLERDLRTVTPSTHVARDHAVSLAAGSMRKLADNAASIAVNSFHGQGIVASGVAASLSAFAVAEDGVVEGVVHREEPIVGVQWHPERAGPNAGFDERLTKTLLGEGAFWRNDRS